MSDRNIFEEATRTDLRFDTPRGMLPVQDLWHLPLTSSTGKANLDTIALDLHRQLKDRGEVVSFVDDTAKTDTTVQLQFDVVTHIIAVRKAERAAEATAVQRRERKQQLLAALARRDEADLHNMPREDLLKLINEL